MPFKVTPIDSARPDFAGLATGIDLTAPVNEALASQIDDAMNQYGVLVFRGQPLTQDQQLDFARGLGPLDVGFKRVASPHARLKYQELADISNLNEEGDIAARNHRRIVGNLANQLWHSDSSFQKPSARYSMLYCVVPAAKGGETEFADMRAAYDALEDDQKAKLDGLEVEHYALHSRFFLGDTEYDEAQRAALPPVQWPIVREHAGSHRKHLYIGAHATQVPGLTVAEGRMMLLDLLEHATQCQFVYKHSWQAGDLVIWDNRCTLHRGRHYDLSERRELRRATTQDIDRTPATAEHGAN
ncbi:TauD/TfdA dioxygenase family protein [Paraburkholderia heleia]|uniref:TauD/TfdA dioxygenase family protein n=1 Tax=Paraburkholderia heleia TaxID=634127 RepID=UPI002AB7ED4F|nr:TauD/TfdA family dioxygenase [Paraburkholderia heleia]